MNFFDTVYDAPAESTNTPTLNEEVADVIGHFGKFWGAFRKQSQTAIEIARRDIGDVVNQAQKELNKLTTNDASSSQAQTTTDEETPEGPGATPSTPVAETSPSTLFSRLQSAIPPNIASTVRSHLPETLKHASENLDFAQLQSNLMNELQRVQGITRAQAEEYVHKSEELLREAVKEAGVVLREAVKIVPPAEATTSSSAAGVVWDGTDMWTLPSSALEDKGEPSVRRSADAQRTVATRAEALLKRLKRDPSIIRHDPDGDETIKEYYNQWFAQEVEAKGGIEGPLLTERMTVLLEDTNDGHELQETLDTLVPSEMDRTTFWTRFFFRMHQITQEEERRKALIESTTVETEDELSWGEEEEGSESEAGSPRTISGEKLKVAKTGSREGSEASYDVVSSGVDDKEKEDESDEWE